MIEIDVFRKIKKSHVRLFDNVSGIHAFLKRRNLRHQSFGCTHLAFGNIERMIVEWIGDETWSGIDSCPIPEGKNLSGKKSIVFAANVSFAYLKKK